jgi:hypothetical protein
MTVPAAVENAMRTARKSQVLKFSMVAPLAMEILLPPFTPGALPLPGSIYVLNTFFRAIVPLKMDGFPKPAVACFELRRHVLQSIALGRKYLANGTHLRKSALSYS